MLIERKTHTTKEISTSSLPDIIFLLLVFFMLSFLIVGSKFKFVFRSFLNKSIDINDINDTIIYLKKLCRIILILCGLIFLSSMVMIAFSFGIESN